MTDAHIDCPKCGESFPLTAALAAPLVEAARREGAQAQAEALSAREAELAARERAVADAAEKARKQIAKEEAVRAARQNADEMAELKRRLTESEQISADRTKQIADANQELAAARKAQRAFEEAKAKMALEIETREAVARKAGLAEAQAAAAEKLNAELKERDLAIQSLKEKLEAANRAAQSGSQQAQGEALELTLEEALRQAYPIDDFTPVAKGVSGADLTQTVRGPTGAPAGAILWEMKRTKAWNEQWIAKLKTDLRASGGDVAILATETLPKDAPPYGLRDGVWVVGLAHATLFAAPLRFALIRAASERATNQGRESKVERLYDYVTSAQFRARVEPIIETLMNMQDALANERRVAEKLFAKRDQQIKGLEHSISGLWGDVQGIAGAAVEDLPAFRPAALTAAE